MALFHHGTDNTFNLNFSVFIAKINASEYLGLLWNADMIRNKFDLGTNSFYKEQCMIIVFVNSSWQKQSLSLDPLWDSQICETVYFLFFSSSCIGINFQ